MICTKSKSNFRRSGRSRPQPAGGPIAHFWTYQPSLPSFRHRLQPVVDRLRRERWQCHVDALPKGSYICRILKRRRQLAEADLLVLGKISLGLGESFLLRNLGPRIAFDIDDAIYLRRPRRLGAQPGDSPFRRWKFRETCGLADLVIAGNRYLAQAARPGANRVEIVPTSVELAAAATAARPGDLRPGEQPYVDGRTLVWIGRPENLQYLEIVRPALAQLARSYSDLRLRIICSRFPDWPEVPIERVPWTETVEASAIASATIGLMPLENDDWTRGKCGFKLLQYMSHALPVVASPVGVNTDIVHHGEQGFLASGTQDWEDSLRLLLDDAGRCRAMGQSGRAHVEQSYDRRRIVECKTSLLECLVSGQPGTDPTLLNPR